MDQSLLREQTSSAVSTRNILLETQSFLVQRVISGANLFLKRRDDATSVRVKKLAISWAGYEITKASNGPTESSRLAPDITELRGQFDWNDAKSHCLAHDMDLCAPESLCDISYNQETWVPVRASLDTGSSRAWLSLASSLQVPVPAGNRIDISACTPKSVAVEVGRRLYTAPDGTTVQAASLCTQIMVTTILRTCLTVAWQRPTIAHVEGIMRLTVTLYSTLGT